MDRFGTIPAPGSLSSVLFNWGHAWERQGGHRRTEQSYRRYSDTCRAACTHTARSLPAPCRPVGDGGPFRLFHRDVAERHPGTRRVLATALEAEVNQYLAELAAERDERGRRPVVRNDHRLPRTVVTAAGPVEVTASWVFPAARHRRCRVMRLARSWPALLSPHVVRL